MKPSVLSFVLIFLAAGGPIQAREALSLRESFEMALVRSETLAIQDQNIKVAEAHYLQALGTALPHVEVRASELIQDTTPVSDGTVGQTFTRRSRPEVAINLRQPLFQGFREFNALKVSDAEKLRNTRQRDRARQILFSDVARAYYTVLDLENEQQILIKLRTTLRQRSSELKERIGLGKSRESELLSNESELAANEADVERTKGLILTARDLLGFLIGQPATGRLVDEFSVPSRLKDVGQYVSRSGQRPDVDASEESVRLAEGELKYEKGARYPTLDLEANYYPYRVGFLSNIDWDVNLLLTVPLFKGGATRGRIREAAAGLKQSNLFLEENRRRAELEIRQAYHSLSSARSQEKALRNAEAKAGANYRSLTEEYSFGLVNNLDVLQSLRDWQEKRIEASRAHYETKLEYLGLLIATGDMPPKELQ